jgi:hypothetical protein
MFSSDIVALPGTSSAIAVHAPAPAGDNDKRLGKKKDKGKTGNDKRQGKKKDKPGDGAAEGPGSKTYLSMPISQSEVWIAGVVVNVEQTSSHYKMSQAEPKCWPVLLTKKKGAAALEICPDHAKHGGLDKPCHKRPNNFDLDYIYKHFARAATPDENKSADWKPPKKGKA